MRALIIVLVALATIGSALAQTKFLFLIKTPAAPVSGAVLLEDNSSVFLLEDNASQLCLEGGC